MMKGLDPKICWCCCCCVDIVAVFHEVFGKYFWTRKNEDEERERKV